MHDSTRPLLFATDPLNNFTVSFELVAHNNQAHTDTFLQSLKDRALKVEVAITEGLPLDKKILQRKWSIICRLYLHRYSVLFQ